MDDQTSMVEYSLTLAGNENERAAAESHTATLHSQLQEEGYENVQINEDAQPDSSAAPDAKN